MSHFTPKGILAAAFLLLASLAMQAQNPGGHVGSFAALAKEDGTEITLSWTAGTAPNPTKYLILARVVPGGTFPTITDNGAVPAEDLDLTDNNGAHSVNYPATSYTWPTVPGGKDYEFKIYPYTTGGGTSPDYRLEATVPTATTSTKKGTVILDATTPVDGISETAATIHAEVTSNGGGTITERGVIWSYTAGITETSPNKVSDMSGTTGSFTRNLTGLNSGVQVYYVAYVKTGTVYALSAEQSFFTFAPFPVNQIASVNATGESTTSIKIEFPSITDNGANTVGYVILRREGTAPVDGSVQDGKAPNATELPLAGSTFVTNITNTSTDEYTDTGLDPNKRYYYAVVPYNIIGAETKTINYRVSPGIVSEDGITFSNLSDIIFNNTSDATSELINYRTRQGFGTGTPMNAGNTMTLARFTIRDGGASTPDLDGRSTFVTSITIQISNYENVHSIGLFDDNGGSPSLIGGTRNNNISSGTVTFTPSSPIEVNDDDDFRLNVRATFKSAVDDNENVHITITGAVATATAGSVFNTANAGGASTSVAGTDRNKINVVAGRLRLTPSTPNPGVNANFTLVVEAIESLTFTNVDKDYNQDVDLVVTIPPSTTPVNNMTSSMSLTNVPVVAGTRSLPNTKFNAGGVTYLITATDDDGLDGGVQMTISSVASTISKAHRSVCYGSNYKALINDDNSASDAIIITEQEAGGFAVGNNVTFSLALPAGFVFQAITSTGPTVTGAGISTPGNYSYPQPNVVEFTYSVTDASAINSIRMGGLKISATHPGGDAPAATTGNITRYGGTANIAGVGVGVVLGQVTADLGPVGTIGFTVSRINSGDVIVDPNETRFSKNASAVQLSGTPGGGEFLEVNGVTKIGSDYRFNPSSLDVGQYVITYTVRDGADNCAFVFTKTFEVYETIIAGLASTYCDNGAASPALSVSPAVVQSYLGPTGTFLRFVYYNPVTETWPTLPGGTFDPKNPIYQPIYAANGNARQIRIGWVGQYTFVIFGTPITIESTPIWQYITVYQAPNVSFSMPKTQFCADDLPVTLTGSPANSNDQGTDHFDPTASAQTASIASGGTPRVWTFNPSNVSNVTVGSPVSFGIHYTYRDPATNCSATTATPILVTVSARPTTVPSADIIQNLTQAVCQGIPANTIKARPVGGTTYKWYNEQALNPANFATGDDFTPTPDPQVATSTDYYVTRTINGCESNRETISPTTALKVTVVINPTPDHPVNNFAREYCKDQVINRNDFQITAGTNIKWYREGSSAVILTGPNPTDAEIANNLGVVNTVANTYVFNVTQTANNCEGIINPTKVTVTVKPRPDLKITPETLTICKTDPVLTLSAFDGTAAADASKGSGTWTGITGIVGNPATGTAQVTPSLLDPDNHTITFSFTNSTTACSNTKTVPLLVRPTITAQLNPLDFCEKLFVRINNISEIDMGNLTGPEPTIVKTEWNFGDGTSPIVGDGNVENDARTRGTYFNPEHLFTSTGSFSMQYTMTTSDGCVVSASRQLQINPKPVATFEWENACMNTISETKFTASSTVATVDTYAWTFNKANNLTFVLPAGTGKTPTVNYNRAGRDSVRLILTTVAQCKDTVQHPIFIVPAYPAIEAGVSYVQDFDNGTDGWIDGGKESSWELGKPNETNIQTIGPNNHAWDTNLDGPSNSGEKSYVLSPCFDFTRAVKPIISMDIWSDTPLQNDGAVIQYNTNGKLLDDDSWTVLGEIGGGANWYDESGISSSPGNQTNTDMGWTGAYGGWRHAAYKLDDLKGHASVVFRIAYASNVPRRDGFAFDNMFIGERTRTVLLESFTNSSAAANTKTHNDLFRGFSNNSQEIAKVEYHTAFPGHDPINAMNAAINGSRAAFYGLSSTGTFTLDGQVATNVANLGKIYDDRVLTPSPFRIEINQIKDGDVVRISTKVVNISNLTLPMSKVNVFTVLVEKRISDPSLLGSNGDTEFVYVARKMLPNAAGISIGQDIAPLATFTVPDVTWDKLTLLDGDEGAIVVFVQNTEGDDKNVYQAAIVDVSEKPEITTGNELSEWAGGIRVFPNPANGVDLTITLPEKAKQTLPVSLLDAQGRSMLATAIAKGNAQHTVPTASLSNGFYIVEIETEKGRFVRKKIMVMH